MEDNESMSINRILNDAELPPPLPQRVVHHPDENLLSILRKTEYHEVHLTKEAYVAIQV